MAGTDQSVNLGGMLNQIAGTIGSGYQIDGQNAGAALGGVIANAVRPEIDMEDPESLKKYANWARNNGKSEEALRYEDQAMRIGKERSAMEAAVGASNIQTAGAAQAQNGEVEQLNQRIAEAQNGMREAQKNNDPEAFKQYQQIIPQLQQMLPAARDVRSTNEGLNILRLDDMLKRGGMEQEGSFVKFSDQQLEGVAQARAAMAANPDSLKKAQDQTLRAHQMDGVQREKEVLAADATFMSLLGNTEESVDAALEAVPDHLRGEFLQRAESTKESIYRRDKREAEAAANKTQLLSDDYVADVQSKIDTMPEGQLKKLAQAELEVAKKKDDSMFVNGTYTGLGRDGAKALWNRSLNAINQYTSQAAGAADSEERQRRSKLENVMLEARANTVRPLTSTEQQEMGRRARENGTTPADEIKVWREEQAAAYRKAQREFNPEAYAKFQEDTAAGIPEDFTDEQRAEFRAKIIENPGNAEKFRQTVEKYGPEKAAQAFAQKLGGIFEGYGYSDTAPASSGAYVGVNPEGGTESFLSVLSNAMDSMLGDPTNREGMPSDF